MTTTLFESTAAPVRMPAREAVLQVEGAEKSFGSNRALDGASIELFAGELLVLLGPNGAGKTTLLRAIAGRVRLDRGTIRLGGREAEGIERARLLGVVPQEIALYPLLSARENLEVFGRLHGVPPARLRERVAWALDWTALAERAREPVRGFSGGMKRRLNLACGVLHEPRIVLLDEPTVGVDPQSRERLYEMLEGLRRANTSILLTTHQLEEAERRCDRVAILDHGRRIAAGTLSELIERTVGADRTVAFGLDEPLPPGTGGFEPTADPRRVVLRLRDLATDLPPAIERLRRAGRTIEDVQVRRPGLHEVFLHLTGKDLRE